MKTLLSDSQAKLCSPRPVRLGHIITLSSPFNQPTAVARGGVAQSSPNVARALRSCTPGAAHRQRLRVQPRCTCRPQNSSFGKAWLCRWWR